MENSIDASGIPSGLAEFLQLTDEENGGLGNLSKKHAMIGSISQGV